MENNPIRPPHNPASAPVMPPGPSALENQKTPPPTSPLSKGEPQHPFPIPAGNRPTEPESKHFWKSKWFILIILLLIILIPATIFAAAKITSKPAPISSPEPSAQTTTPAPDPTASWKTYTSSEGAFLIKYPPKWFAENLSDELDVDCVSLDPVPLDQRLISPDGKDNIEKSVSACITPQNLSDVFPNVLKVYPEPNYQINGYSGYKGKGLTSSLLVNLEERILVNPNGGFSWFSAEQMDVEEFELFMSTFKFTDSSDETASWKTYSGTGFEIKYPSDLYSTETGNGLHVLEPTTSFNNQKPLAATYSITVAPFQKKSDMTLQDPYSLFGNGIALQYTKDLITDKTIQNITIGGLKSLRIDEIPAGQAGNGSEIYTISGNTVYEIVISPRQVTGDPEKNKALYEKILSTFKFTK